MKPEVRATNLLHQSAPEFLIEIIAVFGWSCSESILIYSFKNSQFSFRNSTT